jgi:hypothetical protein
LHRRCTMSREAVNLIREEIRFLNLDFAVASMYLPCLLRLVDGSLGFVLACLRCIHRELEHADTCVSWSMQSPARVDRQQVSFVSNILCSGTSVTQDGASASQQRIRSTKSCRVSSIWQLPLQFESACPRQGICLYLHPEGILFGTRPRRLLQHLRHDLIPQMRLARCSRNAGTHFRSFYASECRRQSISRGHMTQILAAEPGAYSSAGDNGITALHLHAERVSTAVQQYGSTCGMRFCACGKVGGCDTAGVES